jgi:hypothetical protein
MSFWV